MPERHEEMHAGAPLSAWEARMKEIVREVLIEEGMTVPFHVREANHKFVSECKDELVEFLKAQRLKRERIEDIRRKVWGGAILMVLSAIGGFLLWVFNVANAAMSHPATQDAAAHIDKLPVAK